MSFVCFKSNLGSPVEPTHLQRLVGTAHGGDAVIGVVAPQLAEVAHGPPAQLTVHVDPLRLVLRAHENLMVRNSHVTWERSLITA